MIPIEKHTFICPVCRKEYKSYGEAQDCINTTDQATVKVGDIVELKYGFGWFDGDKRWVINPDVDMSKHGFGSDCSMGFYYVVTHIDIKEHRTRYHVFTKAMGLNGYRSGHTFNTGHWAPKKIDAPEFVKLDSIDLIGLKSKYLV